MQIKPRSRPKINRQVQDKKPQGAVPEESKSQVSSDINLVAKAESRNKPTDREPAVLHEQGGMRPRPARRRLTTIDNDWAARDRQRGRLKDALLTAPEEVMERTEPNNPEAVAESKYVPTDYERAVLAKQEQRLKDQVRVPRLKFVEDVRGGRREFDHPDQAVASALLNEAFGTADDQFAKGLLGYLGAALPIDENSWLEYPRADDLNHAISLIAAGNAVDELHAQFLADVAVCRITLERLLRNMSEPMRFDLSEELKSALYYYKYNPKDQIDREVKIGNRPVLEFSIRSVTRLMTLCVELIDAANRYRATFESSRTMRRLPAVASVEAGLGEIKLETSRARPEKPNAARARRLNGSAVHKLPQKTDSTLARNGNGHTPA
jgi:hypothetical protein